jgi:ABC-type Mn2+/Zn2+ transport system permease subunit
MQVVRVVGVVMVATMLLWPPTWHCQWMVVTAVVVVLSLTEGQLQRWMAAAGVWLRIHSRLTEEHALEVNAPRGQSCHTHVLC